MKSSATPTISRKNGHVVVKTRRKSRQAKCWPNWKMPPSPPSMADVYASKRRPARWSLPHDQSEETEEGDSDHPRLLVTEGEQVEAGQPLTEGSLTRTASCASRARGLPDVPALRGPKVYRSQGQNIHDKHFEVIIRKMMSKVQVNSPGDTKLPARRAGGPAGDPPCSNRGCVADGKQAAKFNGVLPGVTKASFSTDYVPLSLFLPAHHQSAGRRGDQSSATRSSV